jgi:PhnB protein
MRIGDSTLVIEAGDLPSDVKPWTCSVYVYVEDVDAVFQRALQFGAKQIAPVEDKPYPERQGGLSTPPAIPGKLPDGSRSSAAGAG